MEPSLILSAKGLEYLIEAAEKITREDVVWCIVGDGLGRPVIEKLIKIRVLLKKWCLSGKERIVRYLSFYLFVLPSVKEAFWAVLEAMAAKLPVIATRVGPYPKSSKMTSSGYIVEPRNSEQIAKRVITLLDNDSRAREMGIRLTNASSSLQYRRHYPSNRKVTINYSSDLFLIALTNGQKFQNKIYD